MVSGVLVYVELGGLLLGWVGFLGNVMSMFAISKLRPDFTEMSAKQNTMRLKPSTLVPSPLYLKSRTGRGMTEYFALKPSLPPSKNALESGGTSKPNQTPFGHALTDAVRWSADGKTWEWDE